MNNEKKHTREEIVRSLRICEKALLKGCGGCIFETTGYGSCSDTLYSTAADLIEELTDRCARYAEEIMELRERQKAEEALRRAENG